MLKKPWQPWCLLKTLVCTREWQVYTLPSTQAKRAKFDIFSFHLTEPESIVLSNITKLRKSGEVCLATLYHSSLLSYKFKHWWLVGKELGQSLSISGSFQSSMVIRQFPVRSSFCTQLEVKYTALLQPKPMVLVGCWPLLGQYPLKRILFVSWSLLAIITTIFNARIKR